MTFLVFFSGWQFILIPAAVKRTSATLCSFHVLAFFNSSTFWGSSSSRLSLFPILGPHGLPFRRWALVLTPSGLLLGFLGSRLANDPSLASVLSFQKNLRQDLSFLRPAQDLHTFFDYLFVLILGVLVFAPAAATPPGSSLGKLSWVALLGWFVSASSILVIRVVNLIDVGQGYMITKRSSHRAQGLLK